MERLGINMERLETNDQTQHVVNIRKALVCGYFMQVAHKKGEGAPYLTVKDNQV